MSDVPRTVQMEASASSLLTGWLLSAVASVRATGLRGMVYALVGTSVGILVALLLPPQYTSNASFIAQGASTSLLPSALQGLAASVGLGTAKDYSPQFYADLLISDPVLNAAIGRSYVVPGRDSPARRTYLEIEGLHDELPARAADAALRHLRRRTATRADVRTNIISLSVTAHYPELSRELAQALLDALDSMNITFRQQQSGKLRQFFETRVADAQRELDTAETALRQFLERNRVIQGSPLLQFEQMRLSRAVDLKRAVFTTVVQQYEEAKIQEARNVPVLTVLAPPNTPIKRSGPPRRFIALSGLLLGVLAALSHDRLRMLRSSPRPAA
jgi:uncharacterized protein involved in exopolysaccharide biosynthesis